MLFNSYAFLFCFLPVALAGYYILEKVNSSWAIFWLAICSFFFYAYWDIRFVPLIIASIMLNFYAANIIARTSGVETKQYVFWVAVVMNLCLLGGFKYLAPTFNFLAGSGVLPSSSHLDIVLPLGISFFTFTQIGYLVDRRDGVGEGSRLASLLRVCNFFPSSHCWSDLAHSGNGAQLLNARTNKNSADQIAPGLTLFAIGLGKKVLFADPLADVVSTGYAHPNALSLLSSWLLIVGYSMLLYFDFSGYSDMAIGLAGMFGFKFPINFNSPFKSRSIIEFWQRWHITLSRYLALLLFNPIALWIMRRRAVRALPISSKAAAASPWAFISMTAFPTLATMAIAGIWHGAGLQFLVYGLLHGVYLTINHAWRSLENRVRKKGVESAPSIIRHSMEVLVTYLCVLVAMVFFRSNSCSDAIEILASAVGAHGLGVPVKLTPYLEAYWERRYSPKMRFRLSI